MQSGRKSCIYSISYFLLAMVILTAIVCVAMYIQLVKHMKEICEYKGRQTANEIVSRAIDTELEKNRGDYINISYGEDGKITSLCADTYKINALENDLKTAINNSLSSIDDNEMGIPIGTLSGITALSGRGAEVKISLHQVGAVDAKIVSEFTSAGTNQTRHTLKLEISTELSAILPGHSTDILVSDEYLIGETIIVGEVPQGLLSTVQADDE